MEEFNEPSQNFKIKRPGEYNLVSLRKIYTKYGDAVIVKLQVYDDEEEEYFLAKKHGELSDKAINTINKGKYKFNYIGYINDKYEYKLERF